MQVVDIVASFSGATRNIDQYTATGFTKMGDGPAAQLGGGQQVDTQRPLPVVKPLAKIKVQG